MQSVKLETLADCAAIFPRLELPSGRGFKGGNETNETETKHHENGLSKYIRPKVLCNYVCALK